MSTKREINFKHIWLIVLIGFIVLYFGSCLSYALVMQL